MINHLAIIMDGNGRWASKRFLPKNAGHKAGANTLRKLSNEIESIGIKYLTVYAFSTENWSRPETEVKGLMKLMHEYFEEYIRDSKNNNMRMSFIGDLTRLEPELQEKAKTLTDITSQKPGLHVNLAINYGGRDEIVRAVRKLDPNNITEESLAAALDTRGMPDPELLIRTGGEMRLSNFLLWQLAYAEVYVTDILWPDFGIKELHKALEWFETRERRFGGRK